MNKMQEIAYANGSVKPIKNDQEALSIKVKSPIGVNLS